MSTIQTQFEGNLTADPTPVRQTKSGIDVCNMRVAVNTRIEGENGWENGDTQYMDVVVWRSQAVNVAATLKKGQRVMVKGITKQRTYTTKDGGTRYVTEVHAAEVGLSLRYHVAAGIEKASEALAPA